MSGAGMSSCGPMNGGLGREPARDPLGARDGTAPWGCSARHLGPAVGQPQQRTLPRHPHCEGGALAERDTRVVADPTLRRPHHARVLHAVAGEDDPRAVVELHRAGDDDRPLGVTEPLGDSQVDVGVRHGLVELSDRGAVERRVELEVGERRDVLGARHRVVSVSGVCPLGRVPGASGSSLRSRREGGGVCGPAGPATGGAGPGGRPAGPVGRAGASRSSLTSRREGERAGPDQGLSGVGERSRASPGGSRRPVASGAWPPVVAEVAAGGEQCLHGPRPSGLSGVRRAEPGAWRGTRRPVASGAGEGVEPHVPKDSRFKPAASDQFRHPGRASARLLGLTP